MEEATVSTACVRVTAALVNMTIKSNAAFDNTPITAAYTVLRLPSFRPARDARAAASQCIQCAALTARAGIFQPALPHAGMLDVSRLRLHVYSSVPLAVGLLLVHVHVHIRYMYM